MRYSKYILAIISLIVAAIMFVDAPYPYQEIYWLPLAFGLLTLTLPRSMALGAGTVCMFAVMSIRYIGYPLALLLQDTQKPLGPPSVYAPAIELMVVEMVVIFSVIFLYYWVKRHRQHAKKKTIEIPNEPIEPSRISLAIILVITMIAAYCIRTEPKVLSNIHLIFSEGQMTEALKVRGFYSLPVHIAKLFLPLYFFNILYNKYARNHNIVTMLMACAVLLVSCLWYSGQSRLSFMMPIVATLFIFWKSFRYRSLVVSVPIAVIAFLVLAVLTIQKFHSVESVDEMDRLFTSSALNAYFGGINNVTEGMMAYNQYGSDAYRFIIDSLRNAMGISSYFSSDTDTSTIFNMVHSGSAFSYSTDQIVPTITQGLMYFGPVLCVLPTVLMVFTVLLCDNIWSRTKNMFLAYILAYFVVIVGWAVPGSFNHFTTALFNTLVPMLLFYFFNRWLVLTRRRNRSKRSNFRLKVTGHNTRF